MDNTRILYALCRKWNCGFPAARYILKLEAIRAEAERIRSEAHYRGDIYGYDLMKTVLAAGKGGLNVNWMGFGQMKKTDIAWAAGLFDGEGSVIYTNPKDRPNPRIQLTLSMTDKNAVEKFQAVVGTGSIITFHYNKEKGYLRQWKWSVEKGTDVAKTIKLLGPYLVTKKPAINKALGNWHRKFNVDKSRNWKFLLAKTKEIMPNDIK